MTDDTSTKMQRYAAISEDVLTVGTGIHTAHEKDIYVMAATITRELSNSKRNLK